MYGKQGEGSIPSNSTFQCICRITAIMSGFHPEDERSIRSRCTTYTPLAQW